jgi:hypothetical protein
MEDLETFVVLFGVVVWHCLMWYAYEALEARRKKFREWPPAAGNDGASEGGHYRTWIDAMRVSNKPGSLTVRFVASGTLGSLGPFAPYWMTDAMFPWKGEDDRHLFAYEVGRN